MEEVKKYKEMICLEDGDRVCFFVKWLVVVVLRKLIIIVDVINKLFMIVDIVGGILICKYWLIFI